MDIKKSSLVGYKNYVNQWSLSMMPWALGHEEQETVEPC